MNFACEISLRYVGTYVTTTILTYEKKEVVTTVTFVFVDTVWNPVTRKRNNGKQKFVTIWPNIITLTNEFMLRCLFFRSYIMVHREKEKK